MKRIQGKRRKGKNRGTVAKHRIYEQVRLRDKEACIACSRWVGEGIPPHHEPPRSQGGENVPENMVTLCMDCHYGRHHGGDPRIKIRCVEYLVRLYGKGGVAG